MLMQAHFYPELSVYQDTQIG
ncbi:MAG TPA: transcriptional regulator, partial [Lactobacillus sp.]|nr:transcriptional regulator [Lactobacillus sp.]